MRGPGRGRCLVPAALRGGCQLELRELQSESPGVGLLSPGMFGGRVVAVSSPVRRDDRVDGERRELRDESDLLSAGDVNSRYVKRCV